MRVSTLAWLVLLTSTAFAVAAAPPAGTVILVEIDDIEGIAASFRGSAAFRLYQEVPVVGKAADGAVSLAEKTISQQVEQFRRFLGFSLKDRDEILAVPRLLKGKASLALVPDAETGELGFLIRYEAKTDKEAAALRSALAVLEAGVLRAAPENRIDLEKRVSVLRNVEEETQLAWCFEGRELVVAKDPALVLLARKATGEGPWQAPLARAVATAQGAPGLRLWADVTRLAAMAEEGAFDEGFRNLTRFLGAIGVRSIAGASGFTRTGGIDAIHFAAPEDSLLARFARDSANAPRTANVPAGTLFSLSVGASADDLMAHWMEILERTDPHAFANAQKGMDDLVLGLGVDAREDVLARLGDGVVLHFIATGKGLEPLATAPVLDHDALHFTAEQIAEAAQWRRTIREDGTLWIAPGGGGGPTAFLLRKDRLWVGKPAALAALQSKAVVGIDPVLAERLPEGARVLMTARHGDLFSALRKAVAGKHPVLAKVLGAEALTGRPGGEAIALMPTKDGATLVHVSTLAPAGAWLAVAAVLSAK